MYNDDLVEQKRKEIQDILNNFDYFKTSDFVQEIMNALPYVALILNKYRQVIFANNTLLETFGIKDINTVLGFRPGEIIRCIHANETPHGCGSSEDCRYCGAFNAFLESNSLNDKVVKESRITSNIDGKEVSFDLQVSSYKFYKDNEPYFLVSISDISDIKRRKALEKVFFHDIINTAGGLTGYLDFILLDNEISIDTLKELKVIGDTLLDDLLSQRDLLSAENDELLIKISSFYVESLIKDVVDTIKHHKKLQKKKIQIKIDSNIEISSDKKLLKRVLLNMLKNGLEASNDNDLVVIGCKEDEDENNNIVFFVKNNTILSKSVKSQIFQRSFSTKGRGRGLGTYSMKLFGERYLGGHVNFTSDEENGTIFSITLPKELIVE